MQLAADSTQLGVCSTGCLGSPHEAALRGCVTARGSSQETCAWKAPLAELAAIIHRFVSQSPAVHFTKMMKRGFW